VTYGIDLLPPEVAYDYEYFSSRLADPRLLDNSVAVRVFRAPLLAVPVGGSRRGGEFPVAEATIGVAVRDALRDRPGFPRTRLRWALLPGCCHTVEWGDPVPATNGDAELGRFYGYSEDAIGEHIRHSFIQPAPTALSIAPTVPSKPLSCLGTNH
jgi:hypothetical protein